MTKQFTPEAFAARAKTLTLGDEDIEKFKNAGIFLETLKKIGLGKFPQWSPNMPDGNIKDSLKKWENCYAIPVYSKMCFIGVSKNFKELPKNYDESFYWGDEFMEQNPETIYLAGNLMDALTLIEHKKNVFYIFERDRYVYQSGQSQKNEKTYNDGVEKIKKLHPKNVISLAQQDKDYAGWIGVFNRSIAPVFVAPKLPNGEKSVFEWACHDDDFTFSLDQWENEIISKMANPTAYEIEYYSADKNRTHAIFHFNQLIEAAARPIEPIPTGFKMLDDYLDGGLYPMLYILGGMSGTGKTTFITQVIDNILKRGKNDIHFYSFEMHASEILSKIISKRIREKTKIENAAENTPYSIIARGQTDRLTDAQQKAVKDTMTQLYNELAPLYIYVADGDANAWNIWNDVRHRKTGHFVKNNIDSQLSTPFSDANNGRQERNQNSVIIVDYLQRMPERPTAHAQTDKQKLDETIRYLSKIAIDLRVPVIALASVNREAYKGDTGQSAYKGSGDIEFNADATLFLSFRGLDKADNAEARIKQIKNEYAQTTRRLKLEILKQRCGRTTDQNGIAINFEPKNNFFYEDSGIIIDNETELV